ncbi:MAG TPA: TIGR04290 family methyltransferase [Polyangiales bacterium]|nr:TIGR04290 family methyltransferase [Polyangiales bacterium]
MNTPKFTQEQIRQKVEALGPWFHNIDLQGIATAPHHFLGDYPRVKWRNFAHAIPEDLRGQSVLDIGCNAGFFSIEMKRRGAARVVGIDSDPRYLAQAEFAAQVSGQTIELRNMSVYDIAQLGRFDLVLFTGVFYHLRHPLLALDLIRQQVMGGLLVFQSMQRGSAEVSELEPDYPFSNTSIFEADSFPRMHFIEHKYSNDETNWWVPNRACAQAVLRSAGFSILSHPEEEVYVCGKGEIDPRVAAELAAVRGVKS